VSQEKLNKWWEWDQTPSDGVDFVDKYVIVS